MSNDTMPHPRSVIKKDDGFLAYYFSAQVANLIVRAFARLPITPNHYTTLSLILGLVAAWCYAQGTVNGLWIGLLLHHISFIFDCCDGQVSRLKGLGSKMGHWYDYHSDKIKDGALLLGLAYGQYVTWNGVDAYWDASWIFIVAFIAIFFQFLRNITALTRDNFKLEHEGAKDKSHTVVSKKDNDSQLVRTLKNSSLFKLSDRVLLFTITIALGVPALGIVLYAILEVLYATASAALNYRTFRSFDKR